MPLRVSGGRAHHTGKAVLYVPPVVWRGIKRTIEKALWPLSQRVQEGVGGSEERGPDGGGMGCIDAILSPQSW